LSTKDKRVRLLGACGQYYVDSPMHTIGAPGEQAKRFFAQLPGSAVLPGFVYMGINIALANQFFTPADPNPNVNTMSPEELIDVIVGGIPTRRNAFEVADDLMAYRRSRNGFRTVAEFIAVAWASAVHRGLSGLKLFFRLTAANSAGRIATAYPAVSYSP
jgi:hypothetical protein